MSGHEAVAKGTSLLLGQSMVSGFFRIFNIMILTRLLFQSEIGQIALMSVIYGFTQFLGALGLNHASPLIIPEEEKAGRLDRVKGFLRRSSILIVFSSAILIVLLFLFTPIIIFSGTLTQNVLVIMMIIVLFSSLETFLDSFLLGRYSVKHLASGRIIFDVVRLVSTIYFVFLGLGILGVALGWLLSEIAAVVIFGFASSRNLNQKSFPVELRPILAFAIPSLVFQAIDVTIQNTDRIILLLVVDLVSLAVYDVILSILFMMSFLSIAVASSLYPVLTHSRLNAEESTNPQQRIGKTVATLVRYILILLVPFSMIAALNSHAILSVLFGSSYADYPYASLSFSILVIAYSLWGLTYALHSVLRSMAETKIFLLSGAGVIIFEIVGCFYLTAMWGLIGCAIIRCIYIVILLVTAWGRLKQKGITWAWTSIKSSIKIAIAALLSALLTFLLNPLNILNLIFTVSVSMVLYVILLLVFKEVQSIDFEFARAIFPNFTHRFLAAVQTIYNRWLD